ncbi:Ldh family oxidoreductase [Synechococcus sp. CCY 9618]|uniref:Ldh family oxidoreductase n=1 Tax=Synechococcus sp. CCY 9618 TaxID=2815602 RepID=UPI001C20FBD1|nr:Ldh family oxidoreductase [Synechococcus sp. CCY 9618]
MTAADGACLRVPAERVDRFIGAMLDRHGVRPDVAAVIRSHLVQAHLWGIDSHGLQQLIGYDRSLGNGRINPSPTLRFEATHGCLMRVDADRSPGQYAAAQAMGRAIEVARTTGMAAVGVTNSNHFGVAGVYTRMAAAAGMVGFATSDTNAVDLAPFGGCAARLGNNPLSWAIPCGDTPVVLDMAAGTVSGGRIRHFAYLGLPIPPGWALDAEGRDTFDPAASAVNAPGSPKGSGLAFIADLLCGPLLGTDAAMFKRKAVHDAANGTGHLFWVLDGAAWNGRAEVEARVEAAIAGLKATPPIDAGDEVLYPGERERLTERERRRDGIPLPHALLQALGEHFGDDATALLRDES